MSRTFAVKMLPITQSIMVKRACKIPVLSKPKYNSLLYSILLLTLHRSFGSSSPNFQFLVMNLGVCSKINHIFIWYRHKLTLSCKDTSFLQINSHELQFLPQNCVC